MKLDYYPNPRAYPRHLRKPYNLASLVKNLTTGLRPRKCTPSAFGISPEGGDGPMDLSTVSLT